MEVDPSEARALEAVLERYEARPRHEIPTFPAEEIARAIPLTLAKLDACRAEAMETDGYRRTMGAYVHMESMIAALPLLSPIDLVNGVERHAQRFERLHATAARWFFEMIRLLPACTNLTQPVQSWMSRAYVHYRFSPRTSTARLAWFCRQLSDSLPKSATTYMEWPPFVVYVVPNRLPDLQLQDWADTGLETYFEHVS